MHFSPGRLSKSVFFIQRLRFPLGFERVEMKLAQMQLCGLCFKGTEDSGRDSPPLIAGIDAHPDDLTRWQETAHPDDSTVFLGYDESATGEASFHILQVVEKVVRDRRFVLVVGISMEVQQTVGIGGSERSEVHGLQTRLQHQPDVDSLKAESELLPKAYDS